MCVEYLEKYDKQQIPEHEGSVHRCDENDEGRKRNADNRSEYRNKVANADYHADEGIIRDAYRPTTEEAYQPDEDCVKNFSRHKITEFIVYKRDDLLCARIGFVGHQCAEGFVCLRRETLLCEKEIYRKDKAEKHILYGHDDVLCRARDLRGDVLDDLIDLVNEVVYIFDGGRYIFGKGTRIVVKRFQPLLNVTDIEFHLAFEVGIACDYLRNEKPEEKAYDEYDGDDRQKYGKGSLQTALPGSFEKTENVDFNLFHQFVQKVCENHSVYYRVEHGKKAARVLAEIVIVEEEENADNGKKNYKQRVNGDGCIFFVPIDFTLLLRFFFRKVGEVFVVVHAFLLSAFGARPYWSNFILYTNFRQVIIEILIVTKLFRRGLRGSG